MAPSPRNIYAEAPDSSQEDADNACSHERDPSDYSEYTYPVVSDCPRQYAPCDEQFRAFVVEQLLDADSARELCDVQLRTTDGHDVPACRALLAAHSAYFRTLFYSDFEEAVQSRADVNMNSLLLRHVLLFCYTGHCAFVDHLLKACASSPAELRLFPSHDQLPLLVRLSAAAEYHGLTLLHQWCDCALYTICQKFHASTCAVLQAMRQHAANHPAKLNLLHLIRNNAMLCFNVPPSVRANKSSNAQYPYSYASSRSSHASSRSAADATKYGVIQLSPDVFEQVLAANLPPDSQEYVLQCIFFWVTQGTALRRNTRKLRPRHEQQTPQQQPQQDVLYVHPDRLQWGKRFAAKLSLKAMRIRFVHDFVIPTGLVDNVDLMDTLWNYVLSSTSAIQEV